MNVRISSLRYSKSNIGFFCALFVIFATILYPFLVLLKESLIVEGVVSPANFAAFFDPERSRSLSSLWNSLWISFLSVVSAGAIGIPLAFLFERFELPVKNFLTAMATLPIVLPPLVGVVAFYILLDESGIIPRALQAAFNLEKPPFYLRGIPAIILLHAYSFYVYFFLFTRAALKRLDGSLIEAAISLGASPLRLYTRVILPQLRAAISGAAIIVFMISMASFTAPLIFNVRTLTIEIYTHKLQGDFGMAVTQSVVLGIVSMIFLFINLRSENAAGSTSQKGVPLPPRKLTRKSTRVIAIIIAASACIVLALPHLTLALMSFAKNGAWTTQILPDTYSFENYITLFSRPNSVQPIFNSTKMALLATFANVIFAVCFAYWNTAKGQRRRAWTEPLLMIPWAIPGTVVAIALIATFNEPHFFTGGMVLVGTFWLLPLAYFIRHLPVVYRASYAAFQLFDRFQEEAAHSLGASHWQTVRRVILPAIWPGVLAGALLGMVMSLGEFVSSVLIYNYANRPVSMAIFSELRLFNMGSAAAYGVILTVLIFIVTWLSSKWSEFR